MANRSPGRGELSVCREARNHIKQLERPKNPSDDVHWTFFPGKYLVDFLSDDDNMRRILECDCSTCLHDLKWGVRGPKQSRADYALDIQNQSEPNRPAYVIFALLIFIEAPMLIIPLLQNKFDDINLDYLCSHKTVPDIAHIRQNMWPTLAEHDLQRFESVAKEFRQKMYQFCPPKFTHGRFETFATRTMMPYYQETRIDRDEGRYAQVFAFKIYRGYLKIPGIPPNSTLARKQLHGSSNSPNAFKEVDNLNTVNKLGEKHIINIIKAYVQGTSLNILFPKAECNLDACLRGDSTLLDELRSDVWSRAPMWEQVCGLSRALDRIINYYTDTPQRASSSPQQQPVYGATYDFSQPQLFGYHFDLKPQNILVFLDEHKRVILKISDFGQSKFRSNFNGTGTNFELGTISYMPPESALDENDRINTRYDVWSLGCVFVEMATFLVGGATGFLDFKERRRAPAKRGHDYCFYSTNARDGSFVLRPAVKTRIDELVPSPQPNRDANNPEHLFMSKIRDILFQMLKPSADDRLTSQHAYWQLDSLLHQDEQASSTAPGQLLAEPYQGDPEHDWAGKTASSIKTLRARHVKAPREEPFQPVQTMIVYLVHEQLKLKTLINNRPDNVTAPRRNLFLVPLFALRRHDRRHAPSNRPHFWIVSVPLNDDRSLVSSADWHHCFGDYMYQCTAPEDVVLLQTLLSGHEVSKTFYIRSFTHHSQERVRKRTIDFLKKLSMRGDDETQPTSSTGQVYSVQVWKEIRRRQGIPSANSSTTYRAPRAYAHGREPTPCRIVFFHSDGIFVIPFSEYMDLEQSDESMVSIAMTKGAKEANEFSVPAALIRTPVWKENAHNNTSNKLSMIPLDPRSLRDLEIDKRNECRLLSFKIEFTSESEAQEFRDLFSAMKDDWLDEYYAIKSS